MISSDIAIVIKEQRQYRYKDGTFAIDFEDVEIFEVKRFDRIGVGFAQLTNEAMNYAEEQNKRFGNELIEYKVTSEPR